MWIPQYLTLRKELEMPCPREPILDAMINWARIAYAWRGKSQEKSSASTENWRIFSVYYIYCILEAEEAEIMIHSGIIPISFDRNLYIVSSSEAKADI